MLLTSGVAALLAAPLSAAADGPALAASRHDTRAQIAGLIQSQGQASQGQAPPSTPPVQPPTPPVQPPAPPPDSLDRIREAVKRPPSLRVENGQLRIYVQVIANWPTFADVVKGYDLRNGPAGGGNPMSHKEFLSLTTPKEMYSSSGIKPTEMLTFAIVNYLGQAIIKKGLEEILHARSEKEIADIRARIDRELAALRAGGK